MKEKYLELAQNKTVKDGAVLGLVIVVLVVIALFGNFGSTGDDNEVFTYSWETFLKQFDDNYEIEVRSDSDLGAKTIVLSRENNSYLIDSGDFEYKNMLFYKDKWYCLDNSEIKEIGKTELVNYYNIRYIDMELVANIIRYGTIVSDEDNVMKMTISLPDFLKQYNYIFKEINTTEEDYNIEFEVRYNSSRITKVIIDYSKVEDYFKKTTGSSLKYTIDIESINDMYFETTIQEYFLLLEEKGSTAAIKEAIDLMKENQQKKVIEEEQASE